MSLTEHPAYLVAVGNDGSSSAVRFAVGQAARRGVGVDLVHVLALPVGDGMPPPYVEVVADARAALEAAAATAGRADPTVPVTCELVDVGTVVGMIVDRAADREGVVLEHRRLPRMRRLLAGSVANGVASRAAVPVVTVPQDWRPLAGDTPRVTVAVQDLDEAHGLLRTAGRLAHEGGAELVVLRAWWMDNGYDRHADDERTTAWEQRTREDLQGALDDAGLGDDACDTSKISISVLHRSPLQALLEASVASDLLVVGRRHHLLPLGTHLGPVARGIVDHAHCPVVLAPEAGR